jgi:hypothetical protein
MGVSSINNWFTRWAAARRRGDKGILMKATLTGLFAVGSLAIAMAASAEAASVNVADAIVVDTAASVQPAYVVTPNPRYIVYSGYDAALPSAGCYWTRMPMYDSHHEVIGWRGRPLAVCPEPRVSAEAEQLQR